MNQSQLAEVLIEVTESQYVYAGEVADNLDMTYEQAEEALRILKRRGYVEERKCWPGESEWSAT